MFISTTAVFLAELVKLVTCLGLVWNSEERNVGRWSLIQSDLKLIKLGQLQMVELPSLYHCQAASRYCEGS